MSHNKFKVGTAAPDSAGDITVSVADLSDVTISAPSAGEILEWSGSAWTNQPVSGGGAELILVGQGETDDYSNATTATSINTGSDLYLYDTNPVNTIPGSSITKVGSTHWVESITLPAGNYILMATYAVEFSATGYFSFFFKRGSSVISGVGAIGENITAIQNTSGYIQAYTQLGSSSTIKLHCYQRSNVAPITAASGTVQGNTPAEQSSVMIWKV